MVDRRVGYAHDLNLFLSFSLSEFLVEWQGCKYEAHTLAIEAILHKDSARGRTNCLSREAGAWSSVLRTEYWTLKPLLALSYSLSPSLSVGLSWIVNPGVSDGRR